MEFILELVIGLLRVIFNAASGSSSRQSDQPGRRQSSSRQSDQPAASSQSAAPRRAPPPAGTSRASASGPRERDAAAPPRSELEARTDEIWEAHRRKQEELEAAYRARGPKS